MLVLSLFPGIGLLDRAFPAWAKFDRQRAELVRLGMDLETERGPWMYVEPSLKAARAVLAWMRGEMGSSSAITAGSACGANEAQHSDGEG